MTIAVGITMFFVGMVVEYVFATRFYRRRLNELMEENLTLRQVNARKRDMWE